MSQRFVRRRPGIGIRFVIPYLVLFATGLGQTVKITVDPTAQSQTHKYWMLIPGGPGLGIAAQSNWASIKPAFIGQLVNQLGINTLQFTDQPQDIENDVDFFGLCGIGPGTDPRCQSGDSQLFVSVNDDNDPNHFNCADQTLVNCPTTFPLTKNDWTIEHYWLGVDGVKAQVQAGGRTPYFILQYNHRTANSAFLWNSAAEMAEEITAVFVHDYHKYNFVPDIVDLTSEPDTHCDSSGNAPPASVCSDTDGAHWTYALLGNLAKTVKSRLNALGFTPEIWCCSTSSSGHAAAWYQGVKAVAGANVITGLSTHWYDMNASHLADAHAAAAVDGLPTIMTEFDVLGIADEFAIEANLEPAGSIRYGDINTGGLNYPTNWLTLLNSSPYSAQYLDGTQSGARGPTWFFPQLWGYVPDGSVQEAAVTSNAAYTAEAFVRPDGTHVVSVITTASNVSPSLQISGLPAGTYGCTYALGDNQGHFLLPCGPNQTIAAGGQLTYTISKVLGTLSASITMAATIFGVQNAQISLGGVSNATDGSPSIAGGSWVAVYGSNLSSTTRTWQASDFPATGAGLPAQLDGVSVTFGGKSAAVYYISPTQLNVQAPDIGSGTVPVQVSNAFGSGKGSASFLPTAPGFFQQGKYVAAVHQDGTFVAPAGNFGNTVASRPAQPGEAIELFATGFGPTTPPVAAGHLVNAPAILSDLSQVQVLIGGANASILWAGIVASGEYQVNVIVPNVPDGDQAVIASVGGIVTQTGLSISIKQ